MKTIITALSALCLLAACASQPEAPQRLPVSKTITIEFVGDIAAKCSQFEPNAKACAISDKAYLNGYGEFTGVYSYPLEVRFVSYNQLGKECGRFTGGPACWDSSGSLVYTDSAHVTPESECYAGNLLLKSWGITDKYVPALGCELGHEVMFHIIGGHRHG